MPDFTRALAEALIQRWLPALPDVHAALTEGGAALIASSAASWACHALSRAFPEASLGVAVLDQARLPRRAFDLVLPWGVRGAADPGRILVPVRNALRPPGAILVDGPPGDPAEFSALLERCGFSSCWLLQPLPLGETAWAATL
jgi:hypothetical protein